MDCYTYREALSARLDGEKPPVPDKQVDQHLEECAPCRTWHHRAAEVSRTIRVRSVEPLPDLTESVLQAARLPASRRWPRVLLAGVALCQLGLGLTQVFGLGPGSGSAGEGSMAGHLFNESTAWNLALGLGLLWSAIRTRASTGLVPVLGFFLFALTGFCIYDLLNDRLPVSRLISHGILVLGFVLLLFLQRDQTHGRPHPGTVRAEEDGALTEDDNHRDVSAAPYKRKGRRFRPTTEYQRAA